MNRRLRLRLSYPLLPIAPGVSLSVFGQSAAMEPDLKTVLDGSLWKISSLRGPPRRLEAFQDQPMPEIAIRFRGLCAFFPSGVYMYSRRSL